MHYPLHALNITENQWGRLAGVIVRYLEFILNELSDGTPKKR